MTYRIWSDLAYAARTLAHHRGATAVAVISIAVAMGPNAALFSIMDRVFMPGGLARAPENLLGVRMRGAAGFDDLSYEEYRELKEQNRVFSDLVASYRISGVVITDDARELVATALVTPDYFGILRIRAQDGRLFEAHNDRHTDSVPMVISDDLWHRRFSARPDIIGASLSFSDRIATIVGIVEPGFRGLNVFSPTDVWIPLEAWLGVDAETRRLLKPRDARALQVMGLLRDGVTKRQAQADLDAIAAQFERAYANATAGRSLVAWSARDDDRRKRVGLTAVALVLAGLVLLVACTNVSTMLLARAERRRRDTAIRLALGASRWRLLRLLIAEAFLVALGASLLGLLLAHWLLGLTPALKPITPLPIVFGFDVNRSVVLYTMFLALATTVICALVPMWQSGARDLSGALGSDASGYMRGGRFARSRFAVLVVVQIAVTQMLLCGAALLLRSYQNTLATRPGFDPDKSVLMVRLASSADRDRPRVGYYHLAEQLAALPGARAASFIHNPPLSGFSDAVLRVERSAGPDAAPLDVSASTVGTGYFALVGTRVLHGRAFERREADQSRSIVVNETFVRRVFPSLPNASEAVGRPVRTSTRTLEIIGVVEDGKYGSLREAPQPHAYLLAPASSRAGTTLLVETSGRPENLAAPLRDAVRAADPDLWIAGITTLEEHTRLARILDEFGAVVTGAMGALSLVLAAIGLYGLTAFWVRRRMRECGVRMALGATPADVIALMQTQAMRPVVIGMVLGLAGGLLFGRVLSSVLFGVRAYDPIALGGGVLSTFLVTFSATRIPARRCARVELGSLLKDE